MSFYGDVDLDEPSDCEGGSDSSDDDALNFILSSRSRSTLRRRRSSSSRGSGSRSRSTSRNRNVNGGDASSRTRRLHDGVVERDDVAHLVTSTQQQRSVKSILGGASRLLVATPLTSSASTAEALADSAADFERMMEEELDEVVVRHVEEQKKRWELGKKRGVGDSDFAMETENESRSKTSAETSTDPSDAANAAPATASTSVAREFYDDIYFDSDDNEEEDEDDEDHANRKNVPDALAEAVEGGGGAPVDRIQRTIEENEQLEKKKNKKERKKKRHPVLTNEELFYDPEMDDEDQKWVDDRRRKNFFPTSTGAATAGGTGSAEKGSRKRKQRKGAPTLPTSDATLSCPACMTTLSMDCQKHEIYKHQYRAMFVSNCEVDTKQVLSFPKDNKRGKKNKKNACQSTTLNPATADYTLSDSTSPNSAAHNSTPPTLAEDCFHPVRCSECETQVAVFDKDEIYYFFNVLASH